MSLKHAPESHAMLPSRLQVAASTQGPAAQKAREAILGSGKKVCAPAFIPLAASLCCRHVLRRLLVLRQCRLLKCHVDLLPFADLMHDAACLPAQLLPVALCIPRCR
jgi:hypothetical protein